MKILIASRKDIENTRVPFKDKTAVISICDNDYEFVKFAYQPHYLLQLKFNDVSWDAFFDESFLEFDNAGNITALWEPANDDATWVTERDIQTKIENYHMITNTQAQQIADFYLTVRNKGATTIICQCDHGESRSAAVAAAIAEFQDHSGIWIFANEKYIPNKYVFYKVYQALKHTNV